MTLIFQRDEKCLGSGSVFSESDSREVVLLSTLQGVKGKRRTAREGAKGGKGEGWGGQGEGGGGEGDKSDWADGKGRDVLS